MDLILWRHADARDEREDICEEERPLTPKGERQSQRMARWLNLQLPDTTKVLVSPTLRTRQTGQALDRRTRTVPALGPDGTVDGLLHASRWPDAKEPVLVVGHQPTLGLTAAYLLAGTTQPWAVRKGSVWWIKLRERNGLAEVVLHAVISPDAI